MTVQGVLLLLLLIKHVIPGRLKNTHSKIVAFLFIINSLKLIVKRQHSRRCGIPFNPDFVVDIEFVEMGIHYGVQYLQHIDPRQTQYRHISARALVV
jgi:hypothetical protein